MYLNLISSVLPETAPEIKYFLIKSIKLFGVEPWHFLKIEDLADQIGVTKHVVSSAINYFEDQSCLITEKIIVGAGRPSSRYKWVDDLEARLKFSERGSEANAKAIDNLIGSQAVSTVRDKKLKLSISNKLLLMALLIYADSCGVVRSLGTSDLVKLTGMSKDRLESQFLKLKRLGYIRSSVSGITSPKLFGLVKSIYFINLKGELAGDSGDTLILASTGITAKNLFSEAQRIKGLISQIAHFERTGVERNRIARLKSPGFGLGRSYRNPSDNVDPLIEQCIQRADEFFPCSNSFLKIASFFSFSGQGFVSVIQMKLEEYASALLSGYWTEVLNGLTKGHHSDQSPSAMENISESIRGFIVQDLPSPQHELLVAFIFDVALRIATNVQADLTKLLAISGVELVGCEKFVIIPNTYEGRLREYTVIEMFVGLKSDMSPKCVIMDTHTGSLNEVVEDEIKIKDRIKYGLLSPSLVIDSFSED